MKYLIGLEQQNGTVMFVRSISQNGENAEIQHSFNFLEALDFKNHENAKGVMEYLNDFNKGYLIFNVKIEIKTDNKDITLDNKETKDIKDNKEVK